MYFTPTGLWNTPTPGGVTSAAQKIPLATAPVTMTEEETYAEYLWRERTESGGEVDKTTSDIRASGISDILPESECIHEWVNKAGAGYRATPVAICVKCHAEKTYCPKCGEKL